MLLSPGNRDDPADPGVGVPCSPMDLQASAETLFAPLEALPAMVGPTDRRGLPCHEPPFPLPAAPPPRPRPPCEQLNCPAWPSTEFAPTGAADCWCWCWCCDSGDGGGGYCCCCCPLPSSGAKEDTKTCVNRQYPPLLHSSFGQWWSHAPSGVFHASYRCPNDPVVHALPLAALSLGAFCAPVDAPTDDLPFLLPPLSAC